ncbi:phosphotransferase [Nocardioides sp. BP30]|uniref:phosphotransferase family protein n=1 Tax=Nocardioides sp. BP30 TaxID=3036374 RepID=UPI0024690227|nr:phosphotransferase [Nocardioides sp. BP30]WGL51193.1 phosphotransferase [Nocardioides sp. BP30]
MELTGLTPLEGGWSGETFLAESPSERSVVRIFAGPRHAPFAAEVNAALLQLVRGLVPVPRVLEVRHARAGAPALLITEYVVATRADLVLPELDPSRLADAGERLGRIAGTLAGMPQTRAGRFVDAELRVAPFESEAADLPAWVETHAASLDWDAGTLDRLRTLALRAQDLLDGVGRTSLVHGDLNPKNVLLEPASLEVAAVLDWEFAHAGSPYADLGNLLRFDRRAAWVEGVLAGYLAVRGGERDATLDLARAADLVALVELAGRRAANPVAARAHDHLLTIAEAEDWHVVPCAP